MTVTYRPDEDILASSCKAIAIPVNTMGVAGKGLAKSAAFRYPDWVAQYAAACSSSRVRIGTPVIHRRNRNPEVIVSFATKREWWNPSQLSWIQEGLEWLHSHAINCGINEIALPKLGCGEGGLEWSAVRDLIELYFADHELNVIVYGEAP